MGPAISSGGGSGIIGDMLGLGVGMAAASAVAPQINGMMQGFNMPNMQAQAPVAGMSATTPSDAWDCSCGNKVVGNFCNNCGAKKPEPVVADSWNCSCGQMGIVGNFCNNCGAKKPEPVSLTWDCECGQTGITGNFCNNCGKKRGE